MVKIPRCDWCGEDPLYVAYHDEEWGVPVKDTRVLFELLMLEGMQAGLSWYTVLKKRDHMRKRFYDFDPQTLVRLGPGALDDWLQDPGLIRHRGKLEALIANAAAFLELEKQHAFADWLWSFVECQPEQNQYRRLQELPTQTENSSAMSLALKKAGFRFVGPTICYAFMQSAGMVNDHLVTCHRFGPCREMRDGWAL
jgi:DNA-3-methyladenine glycosylase I